MAIRKGELVYDKITGQTATVIGVTSKKIDEFWSRFYLLNNVPLSPDYPTAWRLETEIKPKSR